MTLGGLAAAVGLVIDDAIVVVENIVLHRDSGQSRGEAIRSALREIRVPLVGSTITPIVVFLPLISITGVTGTFFRALAVTVGTALLTSLALGAHLDADAQPLPAAPHGRARRVPSRRHGRIAAPRPVHGRVTRVLRARAAVRAGVSAGAWQSRCAGADRRFLLLLSTRSAAICCRPWTKADSFSTTSCPPDRRWPTRTRCCWASRRFSRRRRKWRAPRGAPDSSWVWRP